MQTSTISEEVKYQKDFSTMGSFCENKTIDGICLEAVLYPGLYDGNQWNESSDTDYDSYTIILMYEDRDHINVTLASDMVPFKPAFRESFAFVSSCAEQFTALKRNRVVEDNWTGVMTVAEAKELFRSLKIEIVFPS